MIFFIAASIIGLAASVITIKTLIGYTPHKWWMKLGISGFILFCWFGHSLTSYCRHHDLLSLPLYTLLANCAYIGLGFGFILFMLLVVRDFLWFLIYECAKIIKSRGYEILNPYDAKTLQWANRIAIVLAIILSCYGMYEALKIPAVKSIEITDAKIKEPLKLVQVNDLHINRTTSVSRIKKLVNLVNAQNPDAVVIVGDVVDELPDKIKPQMAELTKIKAKYGMYTVFGNHDFYSGLLPWLKEFIDLKMGLLFNNGVSVADNIYIAGIPDKSIDRASEFMKIDLEKALMNNQKDLYTILLSHTPNFNEEPVNNVDLILSGHTHGGQIFPFHLMVKAANKYLAGLYKENNHQIYVSRGASFWGPPIRLLAPSEITVINLKPL